MHTATGLVMDVYDPTTTTDALNRTVAPSHRIPPEIFVKIIHELLPVEVDYNPQIQERIDVLLTATGICRYWRCAALDHATLWSVVPPDRMNLGELFLQRPRNVPLSVTFEVKISWKCDPAHQVMVSLLPHMQRVEKVYFHAPGMMLDRAFSTLSQFMHGGQLKEISVQVLGSYFPKHKLRQLSHLTHLDLLAIYEIREVLSILTLLPALTSTEIRVVAGRQNHDRIALPANIRHIHLRASSLTIACVLDAMKIPPGVHLECIILPVHAGLQISEPARYLSITPEFFENTSHIEELRLSPFSYSSSGPSGSFCIKWATMDGFEVAIEDFSLLRKLVVDGTVNRQSFEHVVRSAPRLLSVVFINYAVIKSQAVNHAQKTPPSSVDADGFAKAISEERNPGANAGVTTDIVVNGTLEGERLEEFRSLLS